MVGPIRWIWAFLDTPSPDAARSWAYWAQVTGTTLSTPRGHRHPPASAFSSGAG